jgi:hypothetical protein
LNIGCCFGEGPAFASAFRLFLTEDIQALTPSLLWMGATVSDLIKVPALPVGWRIVGSVSTDHLNQLPAAMASRTAATTSSPLGHGLFRIFASSPPLREATDRPFTMTSN